MKRMYAVSTRLDMTDELKRYLKDYIVFYSSIQRRMFYDLLHGIPKEMGVSRYVSYICSTYGILKRTANSIRYDMQGRINALLELKKDELCQINAKIQSTQKKVERLKSDINKTKPLVRQNKLDKDELDAYRNNKASLYYQQNRLNRLVQRKAILERKVQERGLSLCFGTKKLFDAQNRLTENGFKSHDGWKHAFQRKRDSGVFFLGSGDESHGNQVLQVRPVGNGFVMQLRKDRPYEAGGKYVTMSVMFPYMGEELAYALCNNQPVSYRILRKDRKWYLTAMFSMETVICTNKESGVIGIDYNDGFMELVETDRHGNMVSAEHINLSFHGTGSKAESEIKEKLSRIVKAASAKGKDIVIEDLDFRKKKAIQRKGDRKQYNRMLHLFDYHRYAFWLENLCIRYGVNIIKVDPAYTSRIGNQKYSRSRKLTVHRAAAFVIARRGQGFKDVLAA